MKNLDFKMKEKNSAGFWIAIGILLILIAALFGLGGFYNYNMYGMMRGFYGYGIMFFSWIINLFIIGLLAAGIYWLIKSSERKNNK